MITNKEIIHEVFKNTDLESFMRSDMISAIDECMIRAMIKEKEDIKCFLIDEGFKMLAEKL